MKPRKGKWLDRFYPLPFYLRLCLTEAEFDAELLRLKAKERPKFTTSSATTHFFDKPNSKNTVIIVCLDLEAAQRQTWVEIAGLLVHESVHVFQNYCGEIGERSPSSEFEAYMIQWISQQLLEAWSLQRPR